MNGMYDYLLSNFEHLPTTSDNELRLNCPRCGDDKFHLYVNTQTFRWICHRCSERGTAQSLLAALNHLENWADVKALMATLNIEVTPHHFSLTDLKAQLYPDARVICKPIKCPSWSHRISPSDKEVIRYLAKRGIYKDDILFYHLRISKDKQYLVVPFFEHGEFVYYQCRGIHTKDKLNPPKDSDGLGKSYYLFNHDGAAKHKHIVVVEGWADAVTVGRNAVAIQGKHLSNIQAEKISKMRPSTVTVFLDPNDETQSDQVQAARTLAGYMDAAIQLVDAYGRAQGDPNDLGRERCRELLDNSSIGYLSDSFNRYCLKYQVVTTVKTGLDKRV